MLKTNKLSQSVNLAVSPFLVYIPEEFTVQPVKKAEGVRGIVRLAPVAKNKPYLGLFKKEIWNKSAYIHRNSAKTLRFIVGYIRQVCALDKSAVFFSCSHLNALSLCLFSNSFFSSPFAKYYFLKIDLKYAIKSFF